jgi:hypothetical protein
MKITKLGRPLPLISGGSLFDGDSTPGSPFTPGPPGHVPTSNGSNSYAWGSNVALITSNGSNLVQGPFVNFASGSGTFFAVSSNTLTITATAVGGSVDVTLSENPASGSTETVNVSTARTYDLTLTADLTLTLTGAVNNEAHYVTVAFRQDGTGGWEVTHPASVVWADGAPTIDPDPGAVTWVTYVSLDGGTVWYGFPIGGTGSPGASDLDDLTDVVITTPAEGHEIRYRSGFWVNEVPTSPRWEVVMTGTGVSLEPVTNDDEDDWLYAEAS